MSEARQNPLERALAFIEWLTADMVVIGDDDIMATVEDIRDHARIELASIRRSLGSSSSGLSRGSTGPEVITIEMERDEARRLIELYRSGLQVLATTFYKDDQHQDYARHVLADAVAPPPSGPRFKRDDKVQRRNHAEGRPPAYRFRGTVCGDYDNPATGEHGYNVSLAHDPGCIQNFPGYMLEPWRDDDGR